MVDHNNRQCSIQCLILLVLPIGIGCGEKGPNTPDPRTFISEKDLSADAVTEIQAPDIDWSKLPDISEDDVRKINQQFGPPTQSFAEKDDAGTIYGWAMQWTKGGLWIRRRSENGPVYAVEISKRWSTDVAGARVGDRMNQVKSKKTITHDDDGTGHHVYKLDENKCWTLQIDVDGAVLETDRNGNYVYKKPHPDNPVISKIEYRNGVPRFNLQRR